MLLNILKTILLYYKIIELLDKTFKWLLRYYDDWVLGWVIVIIHNYLLSKMPAFKTVHQKFTV